MSESTITEDFANLEEGVILDVRECLRVDDICLVDENDLVLEKEWLGEKDDVSKASVDTNTKLLLIRLLRVMEEVSVSRAVTDSLLVAVNNGVDENERVPVKVDVIMKISLCFS
jgi:hypothetical protein